MPAGVPMSEGLGALGGPDAGVVVSGAAEDGTAGSGLLAVGVEGGMVALLNAGDQVRRIRKNRAMSAGTAVPRT